jgi:cytochrome c
MATLWSRVVHASLLAAVALMAAACDTTGGAAAVRIAGGDPDRGKLAITTFGCGSCHDIPGVRGAVGTVGPPLTNWANRRVIAGQVPNTPEYLLRWIVTPQQIEPGTDMPNMGVSDGQARDIAAYLYTLR